jgi:hypothetical protein
MSNFNFFPQDQLAQLLNDPVVVNSKLKLDHQKQVYFELELNGSVQTTLKEKFGLSLNKVAMRWIKGDTPKHVDFGTKASGTYLIYLTDSPGQLVIDNQEYPILQNTAYTFNENTEHYTKSTQNESRLLMGPMNESGMSVGGYSVNYFSNESAALANDYLNAIAQGSSSILGDNIYNGSIGSITNWKVVTFNNPPPDGVVNPGVYSNGTDVIGLQGLYGMSFYADNIICFLGGSTILTDTGYKPIESLKAGDLVQTLRSGFVKIHGVGQRLMHHHAKPQKIKDQLYILSKTDYPDLTEDLVLTGSHCLLVDKLTDKQQLDIKQLLFGRLYVTENKYRLPACLDERALVYPESGEYTVYHIALENESETSNYGVYANGGLLVESCCLKHFREGF